MPTFKHDTKFINDFWGASTQRQLNMYKSNPEKLSPHMKKALAPALKEDLRRSQDRLGKLQKLDEKWNYGTRSSETYFHGKTVASKQKYVDGVASELRSTMSDWRSSPTQKEAAQQALRTLTGKDR